MTLDDPLFNLYLKTSEIIEMVDFSEEIKGIFMRAKDKVLPIMNYPYRLICYHRQEGKIFLAINLEVSVFGTCCIGADTEDTHYNFGPADENMGFEAFKEKAMEIAMEFLAKDSSWKT